MSERLLRAREVGQRLGMSTAWVLDRWEAGELPGFKLPGGAVRFDPDEIDVWLEERHRGPDVSPRKERVGT